MIINYPLIYLSSPSTCATSSCFLLVAQLNNASSKEFMQRKQFNLHIQWLLQSKFMTYSLQCPNALQKILAYCTLTFIRVLPFGILPPRFPSDHKMCTSDGTWLWTPPPPPPPSVTLLPKLQIYRSTKRAKGINANRFVSAVPILVQYDNSRDIRTRTLHYAVQPDGQVRGKVPQEKYASG